jgi:regulator of protease activity HflC (stomatin/prohibitin superfamily)
MPRQLYAVALTPDEKETIERRLNSTGVSVLEYKWAQIILLSAVERLPVTVIASRVHLSVERTRLRIREWNRRRLAALKQRRSPGRPRKATKQLGEQVAQAAAEAHPRDHS